MKKIVLLAVAMSFAACSSKEKTEVSKEQTTQVVEEKASATTVATAKVKKMKVAKVAAAEAAPVENANTSNEEATASSHSSFPEVTGTEKSSVTCTANGETRKISIVVPTEGGCGVVYNKAGANRTVAVAKNTPEHCDSVAGKIKSNLEAAGYDCGGGAAATEAAPQ